MPRDLKVRSDMWGAFSKNIASMRLNMLCIVFVLNIVRRARRIVRRGRVIARW
jgi:hypothetical protein